MEPTIQTRWRLPGLIAAGCFILAHQVGCAGNRNMADLVLLFPQHKQEDRSGLSRRTIRVSSGEVEIWSAQSPGAALAGAPAAYVLLFSGNANLVEPVVKATARDLWKHRPVEVWGVNYPGFGGSAGQGKLTEIPEAALAAYDALSAEARGRPIFLDGASMGAAVCLFVASRRPAAGLTLQNTPPLRQVVATHAWWNLGLLTSRVASEVPPELDAIANARECSAPLFAVISQRDEVVPARLQQAVYDQYAGHVTVIRMKGARHATPLSGQALEARMVWTDSMWRRRVEGTSAGAAGERGDSSGSGISAKSPATQQRASP